MQRALGFTVNVLDVLIDGDAQMSNVELRIRCLKGIEGPVDEIHPLPQHSSPLRPFESSADSTASIGRQNSKHVRVVKEPMLSMSHHSINESDHIIAVEGSSA